MTKRAHNQPKSKRGQAGIVSTDQALEQRQRSMAEEAKGNPDLERSIDTPRPRQPGAGPGSSVKNSQH